MTARILLVLTGLALSANDCEQADFEKPQPDGTKNLKAIPARLQGRYKSLSDSSLLEITDKGILHYKTDVSSVHRNELVKDSIPWAQLTRDTTFCEEGTCFDLKPAGDSIKFKVSYTDTLIYVSDKGDEGVMRKYRKQYFLNKEKLKQKWEVKKVELSNNELTISSTYAKDDIAYLRKQLKTTDSTLIFNPTGDQFKQFVKEGGFRNQEKFRRQ